jgi:hypothetical protein
MGVASGSSATVSCLAVRVCGGGAVDRAGAWNVAAFCGHLRTPAIARAIRAGFHGRGEAMFRRRRLSRRGGGLRIDAASLPIVLGAGALILVAAFVYLIGVSDRAAPSRAETRIELPNALQN